MAFWDAAQVNFSKIFTTQSSSVCAQSGPQIKLVISKGKMEKEIKEERKYHFSPNKKLVQAILN
jgi:hypothetical protein